MDDDDFQPEVTDKARRKRVFAELELAAGIAPQQPKDDATTCSICYETWTNTGLHRIVSLKCGHLFGQSCIEKWLRDKDKESAKCPSCNSRCKRADIRPIVITRIAVAETSERDRFQRQYQEEKHKRLKIGAEYARLKHNYDLLRQDWERLHQSAAVADGTLAPTMPPSSQELTWLSCRLRARVRLLRARVMEFDAKAGVLWVSCGSDSVATQAEHGVLKLLLRDTSQRAYVPLHTKPIRDLRVNPHESHMLLLSVSLDKTVRVIDTATTNTVVVFNIDAPAWTCTWHATVPHIFFCGLANGTILAFDLRSISAPVQRFVSPQTLPLHSLHAVLSGSLLSASCSGIVLWEPATGDSCHLAYEAHPLPLPGVCTSLRICPTRPVCVAAFRSSPTRPFPFLVVFELRHALSAPDGSIVRTISAEQFPLFPSLALLSTDEPVEPAEQLQSTAEPSGATRPQTPTTIPSNSQTDGSPVLRVNAADESFPPAPEAKLSQADPDSSQISPHGSNDRDGRTPLSTDPAHVVIEGLTRLSTLMSRPAIFDLANHGTSTGLFGLAVAWSDEEKVSTAVLALDVPPPRHCQFLLEQPTAVLDIISFVYEDRHFIASICETQLQLYRSNT